MQNLPPDTIFVSPRPSPDGTLEGTCRAPKLAASPRALNRTWECLFARTLWNR